MLLVSLIFPIWITVTSFLSTAGFSAHLCLLQMTHSSFVPMYYSSEFILTFTSLSGFLWVLGPYLPRAAHMPLFGGWMLQDNFPIKITAPVFKVRGTDERLLVNSAIELFFPFSFHLFLPNPHKGHGCVLSRICWFTFLKYGSIFFEEIVKSEPRNKRGQLVRSARKDRGLEKRCGWSGVWR